ncbi:hypothetical protein WMY93_024565 [Mugilogobius chulae]|uniref:Cystinosin n=1 Tax=Mugilogobius chulae TaxID=88201 RepID=A0AAW0N4S9_9GOBI
MFERSREVKEREKCFCPVCVSEMSVEGQTRGSCGAPASLPWTLWTLWTLVLLMDVSESKLLLSAPESVSLQLQQQDTVHISSSAALNQTLLLLINVTSSSVSNWSHVLSLPPEVPLSAGSTHTSFNVSALAVGQVTAFLNPDPPDASEPLKIRFLVLHSTVLDVLSEVIGWIYFLAWSVSFYPQAWENWSRKSVVGLNLDFLALNLTGFIAYSVFNISLFWVQPIKEEFLKRDPNAVIPVTASDVFFSLHAVLLCVVYVGQALVYQAYMNYQRSSTVGWSIGNVLLDFTGGTLSILQMVLQSYNNNQWMLFFGNPTKFGLGLFSVLFDLLFICQHYCLYRTPVSGPPHGALCGPGRTGTATRTKPTDPSIRPSPRSPVWTRTDRDSFRINSSDASVP